MDPGEFGSRELEQRTRADAVQGLAAQAFLRLLKIAEESDTGQSGRVARFIAATYNGAEHTFDLFDLRAVDVVISDDMLLCMDAVRWAKADLFRLVPYGEARVRKVIAERGLGKAQG